MYKAVIEPVHESTPWNLSFDERMALMTRGSPRAAYFYSSPDTSTFRYRAYNVAQSLTAAGAQRCASAGWFIDADLDRIGRVLDACDVLVLCRNSLYNDRVARLASQARARNRAILFDVDDLVFDPGCTHLLMDTLDQDMSNAALWDYWFGYIGRVGATFNLCDGAIVTNSYLADRAQSWSGKPARVIPNFLNREQQEISDSIWQAKDDDNWSRDSHTHLAYFSGSASHNRDFAIVSPAIARVMSEDASIKLRVVGFLETGPELSDFQDRIERRPLQHFVNLQREIGAVEVNLVPLQDNAFTNCKSELKWFEAAVVGALTIASPIPAYRDVVNHGRNGWLSNAYEWEATLREVLRDIDSYRSDVLAAAREEARERYGWDRQAKTVTAALFESW